MTPTLPDRALDVLAHLLRKPNSSHTAAGVARHLRMFTSHAESVLALFAAHGWIVWRDNGPHRAAMLTSVGRIEGAALVDAGQVPEPLSAVDMQDPELADRVRAKLGWPLRHA